MYLKDIIVFGISGREETGTQPVSNLAMSTPKILHDKYPLPLIHANQPAL